MIHQPIELRIPSTAKARHRRYDSKPFGDDAAQNKAAERTALLAEAVDEAFATLPHRAPDKKQTVSVGGEQAAELGRHTDSLANLLASQLKELDHQRGRLTQLLAQIDDCAPAGQTAALAEQR